MLNHAEIGLKPWLLRVKLPKLWYLKNTSLFCSFIPMFHRLKSQHQMSPILQAKLFMALHPLRQHLQCYPFHWLVGNGSSIRNKRGRLIIPYTSLSTSNHHVSSTSPWMLMVKGLNHLKPDKNGEIPWRNPTKQIRFQFPCRGASSKSSNHWWNPIKSAAEVSGPAAKFTRERRRSHGDMVNLRDHKNRFHL